LTSLGQSYDSAVALSLSILALQCIAALVGGLFELHSFVVRRTKGQNDRAGISR
jgi:hypothetical protein